MTGIKVWTFDGENLPQVENVTLPLTFTYTHTPGRLDGAPESCYASETESDITLPDGWEREVMAAYNKAAMECIRKMRSDFIQDLLYYDMPEKWARGL